jgi:hypothetical protein
VVTPVGTVARSHPAATAITAATSAADNMPFITNFSIRMVICGIRVAPVLGGGMKRHALPLSVGRDAHQASAIIATRCRCAAYGPLRHGV